MEKEIEEIIKKNLPAQVGEVLKTRLEQAERDASTVKNQSEQIISKTATIAGLEKTIADYKQFDSRNSALDKRELEIETKERNRKVFEAELKLSEAEKRISDNTNFVGMVFRSPIFRKSVSEQTTMFNHYSSSENKYVDVPNKTTEQIKTTD